MSKYTEAEEHLICYLTECSMWCKENHLTETFKRAVKALEIADRLEKAEAEKLPDDWFISEFDRGYSIGFQEGYEQALADIRGDNNG